MHLLTLGGLRLERSSLTRPKPLLLLAYLALEGPQDKKHVAELFWPNAKSAARSLNVALTQVRRHAAGAVEVEDGRLVTALTTDAKEFLERVEAGDLDEAEARYGGAFLAGLQVPWGVELEEWVLRTREFLAGHAREVDLQRAEAEALEGRFRKAAHHAERAVMLAGAGPPEPGELVRIHSLLLAGNSTQASLLRKEAEEFGEDLPRSVADARRRLRSELAMDEIAPSTAGVLPASATSLVGRHREVEETVGALREGCRLVSLLGPPGVGKTRLALHCARRMERSGDVERVHFVALDAARDDAQLLRAMAAVLRPEGGSLDGGMEQIVHFVGANRVLLLLDNFEQLVASAPRLSELLASCPNLQLLVTSRERLNLQDERAHLVTGLAVPPGPATVASARSFAAVELFTQRARRTQPDFELDATSLPAVLEICRLVEGLPLGLEIAAGWLRVMPVQAVADELSGNLDLFESDLRDVPARHRSLRNAISWSWNLLGDREPEVLARLSVFRGAFTRDAAQGIAGATIPVLASLVDKSLVRPEPPDRYRLHPLVAQFGRERLASDREGAACERRHAAYFLALAERVRPHLTGPEPAPWLRRLDLDHDDLRAAFDHLRTHHVAHAMRLAAALWRFWIIRGHNQEGRERLRHLLDLPEAQGESELRAWLLRALGTLTFQSGDFTGAEPVLEEALRIARVHADEGELAIILNTLGWVSLHLGRAEASEAYCQEALSLHERLGNGRGIALAHNDLGFRATFLGALREARDHLTISLRHFEALDDERGVAHLRTNLALVHAQMGRFEEADSLLGLAVDALSRMEDRQLLVWARYQRASAALERGQLEEARTDLHNALPLARDVGNRELLGAVLSALADLSTEEGRPLEAEPLLNEARRTWRTAGYPWMWASTHRVAARVALARSRPAEAHEALRASLELAFSIHDPHGVAQDAEQLAWISAEVDPERAARLLAVAAEVRRDIEAPLPPRFVGRHERALERVRHELGANRFQNAWRQGLAAGMEGAREDALAIG